MLYTIYYILYAIYVVYTRMCVRSVRNIIENFSQTDDYHQKQQSQGIQGKTSIFSPSTTQLHSSTAPSSKLHAFMPSCSPSSNSRVCLLISPQLLLHPNHRCKNGEPRVEPNHQQTNQPTNTHQQTTATTATNTNHHSSHKSAQIQIRIVQ